MDEKKNGEYCLAFECVNPCGDPSDPDSVQCFYCDCARCDNCIHNLGGSCTAFSDPLPID